MLRSPGLRSLGLAAALSLAFAIPAQQAAAQDPLIGGLLGGAAGAIIGGAAGGGRGAALGAIIGGATGAIIASEGQRRNGGYYYWRNGCYVQRGDGSYMQVAPNYCGGRAAYGPGPGYPPPLRLWPRIWPPSAGIRRWIWSAPSWIWRTSTALQRGGGVLRPALSFIRSGQPDVRRLRRHPPPLSVAIGRDHPRI